MLMKSVAVTAPGFLTVVDDVPVPVPGDYEALVRVRACGFCNGTDMQILNRTLPAHEGMKPLPTLLGHEGAGEVVEAGQKVRYIRLADRFLHPNLRPAGAYTITYGGMSDYGLVADHRAMLEDGYERPLPFYKKFAKFPADIPFTDGAMLLSLAESFSAAMNTGCGPGKTALVYGAGPMGLALMRCMRLMGTARIVVADHLPERLELAVRVGGADLAVNGADAPVSEALGAERFDIVVDAVGSTKVLLEGSGLLRPFGRLCSMGVLRSDDAVLDITRLQNNTMLQMLNLPYGEYDLMDRIIGLVRRGLLNPRAFYSHVLPRDDIETCVGLVRNKQALKVILTI